MTLLTLPALDGITYPVLKKPMMATDLNRSVSGKVNALQLMSYPLWNWTLPYSFLRSVSPHTEFQTLSTFFLANGGRAKAWAFHDVDDDTATAQSFGQGDGVATEFQLVRTISSGGFSFAEPVFVPTTITSITVAGVPTAAYSEDGGLITFDAAPANGAALVWTGTYNWLVRFDEDILEFEKFTSNLFSLGKMTFTSEPL